jgi:hypothetical protein
MNYKLAKKKVQEVVNRYDPENLIEGGAPLDEYDAYVNRILSLFQSSNLSGTSLRALFPKAPKQLDYEAFAEDISTSLAEMHDGQ